MRIYVDSANIAEVRGALATGFVYGVTTNPTLLKRAEVKAADVPKFAKEAFEAGAHELHLQTFSETAPEIEREAERWVELDPARVVAKIPATPDGYLAASRLAQKGVRVTLTAVYTVRQVVLAQAVGAKYAAVYLGRMRDTGVDAMGLVGQMQSTIDAQGGGLEILAASVRDPVEVEALAQLRVATVTLPPKVLHQLLESPSTDAAFAQFLEDTKALF